MVQFSDVKDSVVKFFNDKKPSLTRGLYGGLGCTAAVVASSFFPYDISSSVLATTAVGSAGTFVALNYHDLNNPTKPIIANQQPKLSFEPQTDET